MWREIVHKGMDILFANGGTLSLALIRVWAVGRKPRIFPGSYTLRNITVALLVPAPVNSRNLETPLNQGPQRDCFEKTAEPSL